MINLGNTYNLIECLDNSFPRSLLRARPTAVPGGRSRARGAFGQSPIHRPIRCGPGKKRAKALLSGSGFRFAPPSWRNRRYPWEEPVMADINATVSNILEKLSKILEKPYNALALG